MNLPDLSPGALRASLHDWLGPYVTGSTTLADLSAHGLDGAINALATWDLRSRLLQEAPESFTLPNGKSRNICYSAEEAVLEASIQELFGLQETPTVGSARHTLLLHILSPARRPMQVTRDLGNFWRVGYQQVRKELRGRYPKHRWPEDPLSEPPGKTKNLRNR